MGVVQKWVWLNLLPLIHLRKLVSMGNILRLMTMPVGDCMGYNNQFPFLSRAVAALS
jgi:hypothetical protein